MKIQRVSDSFREKLSVNVVMKTTGKFKRSRETPCSAVAALMMENLVLDMLDISFWWFRSWIRKYLLYTNCLPNSWRKGDVCNASERLLCVYSIPDFCACIYIEQYLWMYVNYCPFPCPASVIFQPPAAPVNGVLKEFQNTNIKDT